MPQPSRLGPAIGAVLLLALCAADGVPALRGAPLLLVLLAASTQIARELAAAAARREQYLSAPVMEMVCCIVLGHVAYFRCDLESPFLELVNAVVLSMFTLVLAAAVTTELKERQRGQWLPSLLLALLLPLLVAGGLAGALLLQVAGAGRVTPSGTALVVLLLGAAWLAQGLGAQLDGLPQTARYRRPTPRGRLVRVVLPAVILAAAGAAGAGGAAYSFGALAAAGLLMGLGLVVGQELLVRLAHWSDLDTLRANLPAQVAVCQGFYDRHFAGGATDYMLPLAPGFCLAWLAVQGFLG
ncbi:MAG: hypothetical protein IT204_14770 [Fimbriimonadaceae bacterium]|nr:hypothetical protein [Fimbriimonadaceae bacterium]